MKFSEKLQKLRKDNNLSQEGLADKLDVSRQSVSKWESGQTYPEMDKLLTMCKIFNITLDDLTNDEIKYNEVKTKKRDTFSNLIDDLVYIVDKSFLMFKNMESKARGKIIGELIILFLILLLFRLPFSYIEELGYILGYHLPSGGDVFTSLWSFIINTVYLILFVFTYLYIYKTHYLDKYKETGKIKNETTNETIIEEKNDETQIELQNETKEETTEEIHKHKKHREPSHFGGTLFTALGKVSSFCIKGFTAFLTIPFILTLIALFLCGTLMFGLLFKGIIYFGVILLIIAGSVINVILLKLMISFICNLKVNARLILIIFLSSLGIIGIGTGLTFIEFANTEYVDEIPEKYKQETKTFDYQMSDNLILYDPYFPKNFTVDETLTDNIKIEITYYTDLIKVNPVENNDDYGYNGISIWYNTMWNKKILKNFLNDLKDKKIYDYSKLYDYEVTIYTSSNNIEKLKINKNNYLEKVRETRDYYYDNQIYELNNDIDNLNEQIYSLEEKINELENDKSNLQEENENLKNKIKEYKNDLQNLLD